MARKKKYLTPNYNKSKDLIDDFNIKVNAPEEGINKLRYRLTDYILTVEGKTEGKYKTAEYNNF